ncbi:MAG: hypothetical protein LBV09_00125, partial [Deferribacteraceae bacterium]|nr:hypothetical protein [Deferribacteraceae bacterium]
KIGSTDYNDSFANLTLEAGVNVFIKEPLFAGLRYKYYLPLSSEYDYLSRIEGYLGLAFE